MQLRPTFTARHGARRYTYADYLTWTDDRRYELIQGQAYELMPAPQLQHQRILGRLYRAFTAEPASTEGDKPPCETLFAPVDVRLPHRAGRTGDADILTVVQPDLIVVCNPEQLDIRGCLGPPDLIVEVVSPNSMKMDTVIKFNLYQQAGVGQYWIVFPETGVIEVYTHTGTQPWSLQGRYGTGDVIPLPTGGQLYTEQVFPASF